MMVWASDELMVKPSVGGSFDSSHTIVILPCGVIATSSTLPDPLFSTTNSVDPIGSSAEFLSSSKKVAFTVNGVVTFCCERSSEGEPRDAHEGDRVLPAVAVRPTIGPTVKTTYGSPTLFLSVPLIKPSQLIPVMSNQ